MSNTATKWIDIVRNLFPAGIYVSDNLFTSAGATTSAFVVGPSLENSEAVIGRGMSFFAKQDEDMNMQCKVHEVTPPPRIKRPTAICELTGLS